MRALILNSGIGSRMGELTVERPKCMTTISEQETILSRQLAQLIKQGISEVIITTGYLHETLVNYCERLMLPLEITYVKNPLYRETNYIYSIYCAREYLDDDIILMHGDLVFEDSVLSEIVQHKKSCMVVSSTCDAQDKDFKAVIQQGRIDKIGVEYAESVMSAQPLYKINREDWNIWMREIKSLCEQNDTNCYAEKAFNLVSNDIELVPLDVMDRLCNEIDNPNDMEEIVKKLYNIASRTVYMCFSTDIIHSAHINLIRKAQDYGRLIIGVLSDEVVASYKRFPMVPQSERKAILASISGVYKVVDQNTLSYRDNLEKYRPTYVIHGDDWKEGIQKKIREEVFEIQLSHGGEVIEYPYADDKIYKELEQRARVELATPDMRRKRLRKLLEIKGLVTALEAHSGLTGLLVENTIVEENGGARQFDAMWVSSLCDSTAKGKPDIELVDMTSRFRTIDDICEVTTKPIIFDGDTGGLTEHFVYTVRSLERMGVSMVIIEDKTGLKKNSLFGNEVPQTQASIEEFCAKISAGKKAQRTQEFMICARIESLILEKGIKDALERARAYIHAGADAIMIHSRQKEPNEIFEFLRQFREEDMVTPVVVVPTSFNSVKEEEFCQRGANIVIYANQLTRSSFPAMKNVAEMILKNHRSIECDDVCMPFREIIRLIPGDL